MIQQIYALWLQTNAPPFILSPQSTNCLDHHRNRVYRCIGSISTCHPCDTRSSIGQSNNTVERTRGVPVDRDTPITGPTNIRKRTLLILPFLCSLTSCLLDFIFSLLALLILLVAIYYLFITLGHYSSWGNYLQLLVSAFCVEIWIRLIVYTFSFFTNYHTGHFRI